MGPKENLINSTKALDLKEEKMGITQEERNLRYIAKRDLEMNLKEVCWYRSSDPIGKRKATITPISLLKLLRK